MLHRALSSITLTGLIIVMPVDGTVTLNRAPYGHRAFTDRVWQSIHFQMSKNYKTNSSSDTITTQFALVVNPLLIDPPSR